MLQRRKLCVTVAGLLLFLTSFSLVSFTNLFGLNIYLDKLPLDLLVDSQYLTESDFEPQQLTNTDINQYESVDPWRPPSDIPSSYQLSDSTRPNLPHWSQYTSKGQYLKQPLISDYADGSDNIFLMIKTGADVLWKRLPIHLLTTLTRVPNFALYSDKPGSIGGYEVIDVLANVTEATLQLPEFEKYRKMRYLHNEHNILDASQIKIDGGWGLDRFKNIPMLAHAYSVSPKSDWFVFMDADSYIMMDVMTKWLNQLDPNEFLYMGAPAWDGEFPFAHGGSVVVLSRNALEETVGKHPEYVQEYELKAHQHCCGDILLAEMIKEKTGHLISMGREYPFVNYRFQSKSLWNFELEKKAWCEQIQTFHHVTPHDIEILYEYERLKGPYRDELSYYDLYRDFYLPYIDDRLDNWDNKASELEWTNKTEKRLPKEGVVPYESFDNCKIACESYKWCLSFRYISDKQYCGLSNYIRLGKPVLHWTEQEDDVTSGFLISKIRKFRSEQPCDVLSKGNELEQFSEGWFLRKET